MSDGVTSTRPGDIIQIIDEAHAWFPCLAIVTEPKSFGCQACVLAPRSNDENNVAQAYFRPRFGQFVVVGQAMVVPE